MKMHPLAAASALLLAAGCNAPRSDASDASDAPRPHDAAPLPEATAALRRVSPAPLPPAASERSDRSERALSRRAPAAVPGVADVWAIHDGAKIRRDDLAHPQRAHNAAWQGGRVRLFGARNEVVAFQLVVEADAQGIADLRVALPALQARHGAAAIRYAPPAADPTAYAGRPIQVFAENYLHVAEATHASWIFPPNSAAAPKEPLGWIPVQLVPENAKPGKGGFPLAVAPKTNQAFWFDLYLDKDLPAGLYDGAVEVRAGGRSRAVPITLEVLDFALPDENTLDAMLYFEPGQVERYHGHALDERYHRLAHRHRVEFVHAYDVAAATAALGRFDGSAYTAQQGYAGPGEAVGDRLVPATFYGPGAAYDAPAGAAAASDAWMNFLAANIPAARTFVYMPDEPGPAEYARIQALAQNLHENPGPGGALSVFVTHAYTPALDGAVDIWCAEAGLYDAARARSERQKGRSYWFYNGQRPATGAPIIDAPATDARVQAWAAFKTGADAYFYWHVDHWRHNEQKVGERDQNVWASPITFDNRGQPKKSLDGQGFANGDGVLIYPGEEVLHPEEDRGIAGPIATVQLANLRRGLQDHAYLTLAREKGLDAAVDAALDAVVPAVFDEAGGAVGFAERGEPFEAAREALGRAIAAAK